MSKLDYCFESHKSPTIHAIKKRIWYDMLGIIPHIFFCFELSDLNIHATINKITLMNMLGSITHQKFHFYDLPTQGRAGIKLGDAWYVSNVSIIFYCSMLLYYQSWMFYNHFIVIVYHFLVLTYWHSAKCQLFFSMFFTSQEINIKWSPNAAKLLEDVFGPEDI